METSSAALQGVPAHPVLATRLSHSSTHHLCISRGEMRTPRLIPGPSVHWRGHGAVRSHTPAPPGEEGAVSTSTLVHTCPPFPSPFHHGHIKSYLLGPQEAGTQCRFQSVKAGRAKERSRQSRRRREPNWGGWGGA